MAAFHHPPSAERGFGRSIPSVSTYSPRPYPSDSYADVPSILIPSAFKGAGAKGARGTAAGDTATSRSSSYTRGAYAGRGALGLDSMAGMLYTRSLNSFCFGSFDFFYTSNPTEEGRTTSASFTEGCPKTHHAGRVLLSLFCSSSEPPRPFFSSDS